MGRDVRACVCVCACARASFHPSALPSPVFFCKLLAASAPPCAQDTVCVCVCRSFSLTLSSTSHARLCPSLRDFLPSLASPLAFCLRAFLLNALVLPLLVVPLVLQDLLFSFSLAFPRSLLFLPPPSPSSSSSSSSSLLRRCVLKRTAPTATSVRTGRLIMAQTHTHAARAAKLSFSASSLFDPPSPRACLFSFYQ